MDDCIRELKNLITYCKNKIYNLEQNIILFPENEEFYNCLISILKKGLQDYKNELYVIEQKIKEIKC